MSDEELTKLESALKSKDENTITNITMNHSTSERVKMREKYKSKFNRDLIDDIEKYTKSDLSTLLTSIYKDPVEYDTDLLYKAMKGIGTNDDILIEVISFRNFQRLSKIKEKFQEKYKKDLISEIKSETSGDYKDTLIALLEKERSNNKQADLDTCQKIAEELYGSGEGKLGTNESTFIKYFTTLSAEEISIVGKEYHKKYKKNMLDVIENEFGGNEKKLLTVMLYALFSPSEFFAKQIMESIKGVGTDNSKLIRSIISRYSIDMKKVKKYFKKMYNKELLDEVKDDVSGSYGKILEALINKHD